MHDAMNNWQIILGNKSAVVGTKSTTNSDYGGAS